MNTQKSENNAGVPSASHTPGPWAVRSGMSAADNADWITTAGCTPRRIARVSSGRLAGEISHAEGHANAHLIAAAPEMLEALQIALLKWEHPNAVTAEQWKAWGKQARAAIAKANAS
jgi:hypothetical protein